MKNKEIEEIRKLMTEVENRLQALEAIPEPERRLWNVDEICGKMECLTQNPYSKLKVVADYCNEMDEEEEGDWHYYPILKTDMQLDVVSSRYIFPCPHFNSGETLKRLISENTEFFKQLLRPKE